jgi:ribosomal protein L16/L10AE
MYWIEICNDGSYMAGGQEYPILADGIVERESYDGERSGNDWAKITIPFRIETAHGVFAWEVEVIEYLERDVTSLLGYRITEYPDHVLLKDEVAFRIQDGWAYPKETTLDLQPQVTKMRLV